MIRYSIVVPAFNEEEVIAGTHEKLRSVMDTLGEDYEIIFINDGSRDDTEKIISGLCEEFKGTKLINFSRNFGHQVAVTAGMAYSAGQAVIIIDADLQDPPEIIPEMVKKWKEGYDVVYGQRLKRKGETFFKKFTAKCFYRFLNSMTDVSIPVDTGDFRLIDRKVCDVMNKFTEKNRYVRGMVSWVGFKQTSVEYVREKRMAGKTKYPLKKMLKLASDAVLSFSYKPLKIAGFLGVLLSLASFIYLVVIIFQKLFTDTTVAGWASMLCVILFFNGVTLILNSINGQYIGRIYEETKNRPLYIVADTKGFEDKFENKFSNPTDAGRNSSHSTNDKNV